MNAVTYKEVFPLIKENKMWLGCSLHATKCNFIVSNDYDSSNTFVDEDGIKKAKINNAVWFTNLEHSKRHEKIDLYKHYNPEEYPKYDNYDAIEVSKTCEIPMDYEEERIVTEDELIKLKEQGFDVEIIEEYNN